MATILTSSNRHDWMTPPWFVEVVREFFGGKIDLDPCAGENTNHADANIGILTNGLSLAWEERNVYCNPPFNSMDLWVNKCIEERTANIILLAPSRTSSKWYQRALRGSSAFCLLDRRVHFINPATGKLGKGGSTFGCTVFAFLYTAEERQFKVCFERYGWVYA